MSKHDELMTEEGLTRLDEERGAREATKYRPARCRLCKCLFTPKKRKPDQRFCCANHQKEYHRRTKVLPLLTLIVQGRRQESAPRACLWCDRPLPPPGKTGVLRQYHDTCRTLRCRARKRGA